MSVEVVGFGYHDLHFRWDLTTPQAVWARLESLPGQGEFGRGRKLYAERDRFGQWQHFLGPRHVMVSYAGFHPNVGDWRRLEVQSHLGPEEGEDDLCPLDEFPVRWLALQQRMALWNVLPAGEPRVTRMDVSVDVAYGDPADGHDVLQALRFARFPNGWYAEWQGPPPYTTVAIKSRSKTIARVYCRNTKKKNGGPMWGKLRFETESVFPWQVARPIEQLESPVLPTLMWSHVFGAGRAAAKVTRIAREVQTVKLIERVQLGEITYAQFERMTAFLDAERLGMTDRVYTAEQARARRREAKSLGLSTSDAEMPEFDAALDDLLAVPRSVWAA